MVKTYTLNVSTADGRVLKKDTFSDYDTAKDAWREKITYVENNPDYGRKKTDPLTEVAPSKGEGGDATSSAGSENYMDVIQETATKAPITPVKEVKWSYEESNPLYSGGAKPTQTMRRSTAEQASYEDAQDTAARFVPQEKPITEQVETSTVSKVQSVTTDANFQKGLTAAIVVGGLYYLSTK